MTKQTILFLCLSLLFISADDLEQPYNRIGYAQEGNASYYADKFHGRKTANGETYDMYEMTAAHPRSRFNTKMKITNLNNNKTIVVRINDRGPYSGGRIIDLSKAAAKELDMIRWGVIPVKTEIIDIEKFPILVKKEEKKTEKEEKITLEKTKEKTKGKTKVGRVLESIFNKKKQKQEKPSQEKPKNSEATDKPATVKEETKPIAIENKTNTPTIRKGGVIDKPQQQVKTKTNEEKFGGVNTYSLWGTVKYPDGFGVQIASYSLLEKALEKAKLVYEKGFKDVYIQTGWAGEKRIFRILVGEGSSETVAATLPKLKESGYSGFVKQHY
jgi:rare lipoprotein A